MKKYLMCLLVVFFVITSTPVFAKDWTEFGGSPERLRYSNENIGPPIYFNWGDPYAGASMSQPILIGDKIYHLGGPNLLIYDAKYDGKDDVYGNRPIQKINNGGDPSHSDPTWANGGVYYGTGANSVYRPGELGYYNLAYYRDGMTEPLLVGLESEVVTAPLILSNDIAVIATADGSLILAKDMSIDKIKAKKYGIGNGRISSSAGKLSNDSFVIGSDGNRWVKAYKVVIDNTGHPKAEKIWEYLTSYGVPASISVDGGKIFFSDINANFYCLNSRTGELLWKNTDFSGGFINDSAAVSPTGVFFNIRNYGGKGRLVRLNKESGVAEWSAPLDANGANSPVILGKMGYVIVGDTAGWLYVFDGVNGDRVPAFKYEGIEDLLPKSWVAEPQSESGSWSSRFKGLGGQITIGTGNMQEGLLMTAANFNETEGGLAVYKLPLPVDLSLSDGSWDESGEINLKANFPLGLETVDTTVIWGTAPASTSLDNIKKMSPEELSALLPNSIDVDALNPGGNRNLNVEAAAEDGIKAVFVINPTRAAPADEAKWDNNYLEIEAPILCTDISVTNARYEPSKKLYEGDMTSIIATIHRDERGPDGPVEVYVTMRGSNLNHAETIFLNKGESATVYGRALF
ncbi:MAG: PQQ-binding-like beta-propeller repeat protein [Firmicutes bacterium]|nr:PQQ-binding-like beta-propeller repeat protein [Bacillota bacterium]